MKERATINQDLCTHVRILLAGGASGEQAAKITNTSAGTVSRIRAAGFDYPTYLANTQARRIREKDMKADRAIAEAFGRMDAQELPGQMQMEIPEQRPEMSEQTKMMRFQAGQVDKLLEEVNRNAVMICTKLDRLNDTMSMILRAIRKE